VAIYVLSDVHLRLDRPDRGQRLAKLVDRLGPNDELVIGGDLCDFWFASRERRRFDPLQCPGLRALVDFQQRGGQVTVLPGNHDHWLGTYYEQRLGFQFQPEPWSQTVYNHSVLLVHGHRLGARKPWKAVMESRAFLFGFQTLPEPLARRLADRLEASNIRHLEATHRRHLAVYRAYAREIAAETDLILLGHVHDVYDEPVDQARMIVLGDWLQGSSYLKLDDHGPQFVIERQGQYTLSSPTAPKPFGAKRGTETGTSQD